MKWITAAVLVLLASGSAIAASPTDPVRAVADILVGRWDADAPEVRDYFDPELLDTLYSKDFAALYREAAKRPAFEVEPGETASPFDYDPIQGGQDGCPIKDLTIEEAGAAGSATAVDVTFKTLWCWEGNDEAVRGTVARRRFLVISEEGRPVIDDVVRTMPDGTASSLKDEMKVIASLPAR